MDYYIEILLGLYKSHGELLFENPSVLKDEMTGIQNVEKSKIYALASAIEEKVPITLRDAGSISDDDLNLISKGFAEGTGIKEELANWAVRTLNTFIRMVEEDPLLRKFKRKTRVHEGTHIEIKQDLVKMTVRKAGETLTLSYDGSSSFLDFVEPYLEEGEEILLEISGDIEIERPITVQNRKLIISGLEKSTIHAEILPAFEVVKGHLIIENLAMKFTKEPDRTIGMVFATDSSVEIRNCEISGAGVKLQNSKGWLTKISLTNCKYLGIHSENSELKLTNSTFDENGIDIFSPQIRIKGGIANVKNCKIQRGNGAGIWGDDCEINVEKTSINGNYYYGIFLDSGAVLNMLSSRMVENGNSEEDYPQLKAVSSKVTLKTCRVLNGINNSGIWLEDRAFLEAEDLKVTGHYYHGIVLRDDSELIFRGGELARNGNEDEDKPQILMESSRGYLKGLKIHGGMNNSGVVLDEGSRAEIVDTHIYRHFFNALTVRSSSEALLSNCEIRENGNEYFHAPQFWASSAYIKIEKSSIYGGIKNDGIFARNSTVEVIDVSIYNHARRAIFGEANSVINVSKSRVYLNNRSVDGEAQIEVKSSSLSVTDSDVDESYTAAGIYAGDISNVVLSGVRISENYGQGVWLSSNASFHISDCLIEANAGKDGMFPQVLVTSSRGKLERSKILKGQRVSGVVVERSFLQMSETFIEGNENFGVYALSNSVLEIASSEIRNNGQEAKDYAQVKVENSKLTLKSSQISSGVNNCGLSIVEASYAEVENTVVSNHQRHGIELYYNSEMRFFDGEIFGNGSEAENFAQVWIGSSYAQIKNSSVHDGKNNMGIGVLKSYVEIESSKVFGHREEAINAAWYSGVKLKECKVYSNASNQNGAQIVITSSHCIARGCEVFESLGGDGIRLDDGGVIELENLKITGNKGYGIVAKNGSEVKISGSEFSKNNEIHRNGCQIQLESARGTLKNCKVFEGTLGGGIRISSSPMIEIYHTVISDHKGAGIEVVDNFSRLKIVGINTFRNARGGLVYKNPYKVSVIESTFEDGSFRKS